MGGSMQQKDSLEYKIEQRLARVGIIGLGYVGLPLAAAIADVGFQVTGIDIDVDKVAQVNRGCSYISDLPSLQLAQLTVNRHLTATTDAAAISELDIICICVPTPLSKTRTPDISYIVTGVESVAKCLKPGQLIVLESTTYPGTTEEVARPILEREGLQAGQDFYLTFSPERIDPGNDHYHTGNIPKVVGGVTHKCTELASLFYQQFINKVYSVSSSQAAETVKLLENTFRAVNIALANEFAQICDKMSLDVWEIVDAAATKPFGFMPFYPGPGLGGHCIPVDPHYLAWKARLHGHSPRLIDLASDINAAMPEYVVGKVAAQLDQMGLFVKGARILIIGVAYKRDVPALRESPALEIIRLLQEGRAQLSYHDPLIPELMVDEMTYLSIPLTDSILTTSDCILIVTDHTTVDYELLARHTDRIVDTRNCV